MTEEQRYGYLDKRLEELERRVLNCKRAEEACQRIAAEQTILLSTIPAMIFWIDREGAFIRVNEAFAKALHKSPDEIQGRSLFALYPEEMAGNYYNDNLTVMDSGAPVRHIEEPVGTRRLKS